MLESHALCNRIVCLQLIDCALQNDCLLALCMALPHGQQTYAVTISPGNVMGFEARPVLQWEIQ